MFWAVTGPRLPTVRVDDWLHLILVVVWLGGGEFSHVRAGVDFSHDIAPILRDHCGKCHIGTNKKGGLSFNSRDSMLAGGDEGQVIKPGQSAQSRLIEVVVSRDADIRMPPEGAPLTEKQVALLTEWIDAGALWDEGFVFQKSGYEPPLKPRRPELPPIVEGRSHPIDRLIDADLAKHHRQRPGALDDVAFVRRTALDLTGLLPAIEPLQDFIADSQTNRRERWIRQLLADDTAYAEHWLTFWNDLFRNDYGGTGFITGGVNKSANGCIRRWSTTCPMIKWPVN